MRLFSKDAPLRISCYGDSNTRFYLGDEQCDGPDADSYPHQLQELFRAGGFAHVAVVNNGYPDMQTDFALAHFDENTAGAQLCILGFGTNNIRQPDADLDSYLRDFGALFDRCHAAHIEPMALLIPWYSADYASPAAQRRLPVWNRALAGLCAEKGAQIIDVASLFSADPARFYNERRTAHRHFSPEAAGIIARMIFTAVAPLIR